MTNIQRATKPRGELSAVRISKHGFYSCGMPDGLPRARRLRSRWLELALRARLFSLGAMRGLQGTGIFGVGRLYASVIRANGGVEHLGLLSTKLITDAGVAFLVDDWDNNGQDLTTMNYHGCGTGVAAENVTDTALGTESTTALNPDSTRATGTRSRQPLIRSPPRYTAASMKALDL